MSCYRPKKGFPVGLTETGKTKYKIVPFETDFLVMNRATGQYQPERGEVPEGFPVVTDWVQIPCGKCIGCKLDYARDWTCRLMCEYQLHASNTCWFLTLTYAPEHVPYVPGADHLGEYKDWQTLDPRDFTLFMKRLRKQSGDKIVFYAAGEYGSQSQRPHYHLIVFGLHLDGKLEPYKMNDFGEMMYKSEWLDNIWQKGFVTVGSVTARSCGYVARYCMKKINSQMDDFSNRVPEFVRMSRRQGIGKGYLETHQDIFDFADFCLPGCPGNKFIPPRYFKEWLRRENPRNWEVLHDAWKNNAITQYENACLDERPYLEQLKSKELIKKQKISGLLRRL